MTLEEYNKKMSDYSSRLSMTDDKKEWDTLYNEVSQFQSVFMGNVLNEYQKSIDCKARQVIYNLMHYAVNVSQSGSSIVDVDTKELADEIDNILWEEIGDYLLDYQIYEEDNHWVVDCMFAGNFIPSWDGWQEE